MKMKGLGVFTVVAGLCLVGVLRAQTGTESPGVATRVEQLAAERNALQAMLADANTLQGKRALIQQLLEWNARGVTIDEARQVPAQPVAATTPSPANNLAEAEAAPLPAHVSVGGGAMLQNFSRGRDAEASAKAASSLGLVKAQQELEGVTRESEAKLREAQQIRNAAGATALAQRQQDAASMASQQAAGSMGNMLGDSLVQSVQQGAQAAGQALGGGAAGRMGGALGPAASGGGAVAGGGGAGEAVGGAAAAGASAAAGQIFGGGGAPPAVEPAMGSGQPAPAGGEGGGVAVDENATMAVGARLSAQPYKTGTGRVVDRLDNVAVKSVAVQKGAHTVQRDSLKEVAVQKQGAVRSTLTEGIHSTKLATQKLQAYQNANNAMDTKTRKVWDSGAESARVAGRREAQPQGRFDAFCQKHGKYGGEISRGTACPRCEAEKHQMWDAFCKLHGKYGGRGPVTSCPKCDAENKRLHGAGFIR
jgi:hypothetical protein